MALADIRYSGPAGGRSTDAPRYGALVEDGFRIASELGLDMNEHGLTVKAWVLAGRLGYLRTLIGAWEPSRRAGALREEHAAACKPSREEELVPVPPVALEASEKPGRKSEAKSERKTIRLAPSKLGLLERRARRGGQTAAQLIQQAAEDIADLEHAQIPER